MKQFDITGNVPVVDMTSLSRFEEQVESLHKLLGHVSESHASISATLPKSDRLT